MNQQLSTEEVKELIKDKKVWLLDVREGYEFNAGHIKGAKLVPSTRFDEEFDKLGIKKNDKIILYCRTGSRSDFILRRLLEKGYKNSGHLEMGLVEWMNYGEKVVK